MVFRGSHLGLSQTTFKGYECSCYTKSKKAFEQPLCVVVVAVRKGGKSHFLLACLAWTSPENGTIGPMRCRDFQPTRSSLPEFARDVVGFLTIQYTLT